MLFCNEKIIYIYKRKNEIKNKFLYKIIYKKYKNKI